MPAQHQTSAGAVSRQAPPWMFWLICALLAGLFWSLAAFRHALLQSNGFDPGIYEQVAWQMSQGLEPRSTLLGLHHVGNHGLWVFYAIAPINLRKHWKSPLL